MAIYRGPGGPGDATTDATNEATVATNKAAEAASSAANAASSASTASTKATQASNSATSAATSASNASTSATAAASSATAAQSAETGATTSATNAASSAYDASTYATTATTQANAASTSATNAATSATTASTQATNAANSATASATSATNAATSATNAAASYDSFDDRYLGAKSSAPTTDNDGDALLTGALYWDTTAESLYLWDGAAWNAAAFSATGAVTSFNTRTGAVTLSSADVTNALGFTPASGSIAIDDLTDVTITTPSTNQVLKYNGSVWVNDSDTDTGIQYTDLSVSTGAAGSPALSYNNTNGVFNYTPPDLSSFITASSTDTLTNKSGNISQWTNDSGYLTSETYTGTVTSVAATVPTGFTVTGSPITASGTLAVAFDTGYALPTSASQTNWDTAYGWGDHSTQGYALDSNIGVTIQAYDADTAKVDVAQTFTVSQRGTVTSDNDLSFDQNATNNFSCTPTAGGTLTFTNHTSGQSGYVLLDNSGGYAITAAATTKIHADDLTTISTAGVYLLSYFDNGTNAYITVSKTFS